MSLREQEWCLVIVIFIALIIQTINGQSKPNLKGPEVDRLLITGLDAESLLAAGRKLELATADEYDLAQISGISNQLATLIHKNKALIMDKANGLPDSKKHLALSIVYGIAEKKASKFGEHLRFNEHITRTDATISQKYTTFFPQSASLPQ